MANNVKVLYIEDSEADRELFREFFSETNFNLSNLSCAPNLKEGIRILEEKRIDVLLLDLSLPDSVEFEGLSRIHYEFPRLPIIILTGLLDDRITSRAFKLNAQDFLIKGEFGTKSLEKSILYSIERKKIVSELERTNERLEELAYIAAHDIKAPITNLKILTEFLEGQKTKDLSKEELFQKMKTTINQVFETIRSINDIIELKRSFNTNVQKVSIKQSFEQVMDSIGETVGNVKIEADFSEIEDLMYNPFHLNSILQNLIINSIKYKKDNEPATIHLKSSIKKGMFFLKISDNGIGMNLSHGKDKVFGLFKRLHNHVEGKGMGLHIVKSIVESYDGRIEVESEVGVGTTFKLYLTKVD